jgi:hypothetical protein
MTPFFTERTYGYRKEEVTHFGLVREGMPETGDEPT